MSALISRSHFKKLVKEHKTEHRVKGLRSRTQFVTMLFSQLTGQHGLRSMEQSMNNQRNGWYHMGISNTEREVKRSTLPYANAHRRAELFKAVFLSLLIQAQAQMGSRLIFYVAQASRSNLKNCLNVSRSSYGRGIYFGY
jgi:hypothetical protein